MPDFMEGLGDAIADIREKLVEEPMWGRSLSEHECPASPEPEQAPQWPEAREPEPEPQAPEPEHGIDR